MRKVLIAAIVASALFAVGAFAAELTINAEDVASGQDSVDACADEVKVEFDPATWDGTNERYEVPGFVITFYDGGALTNDCDTTGGAEVVVQTSSGDNEFPDLDVSAGTLDHSIATGSEIAVSEIDNVAVLVEGFYLNASGDQFTPSPTP